MARLVEPAGWVTDIGNGPYATEQEAEIAEVLDWIDEQARACRQQGFEYQMDGKTVQAATMIGREWAFYRTAAKLGELIEFDPATHDRWKERG